MLAKQHFARHTTALPVPVAAAVAVAVAAEAPTETETEIETETGTTPIQVSTGKQGAASQRQRAAVPKSGFVT